MQVDGPPQGRDRPKRMWMEVVTIDLKKCNISEDLVQDRSERRNKIHVAANPIIAGARLCGDKTRYRNGKAWWQDLS